MRRIICAACFAITAAIPLAAAAETAFTVRSVDVFAGPSSEYPPISQLPPSYRVDIVGCLADWSWCDVTFAGDRGWIYAGDLVVPFQGSRVAIIEYGPRIHLRIVSFSLIAYWDAHYRTKTFYRERTQWAANVQIQANRGGRPPSGATNVARAAPQGTPQTAPSTRSAQAPRETTKEHERQAKAPEKARPAEKSRAAETARAPAEERRGHVAQAPQPEQAPQRERERKPAHEAQQPSHAASPAQVEPHVQPEQRAQTEPHTPAEQHTQPSHEAPQTTQAPEASQHEHAAMHEAGKPTESAEHESAPSHEAGKAKEERQANQ